MTMMKQGMKTMSRGTDTKIEKLMEEKATLEVELELARAKVRELTALDQTFSKKVEEEEKTKRAKIKAETPRCKYCNAPLDPKYKGMVFKDPILPLCGKHYYYYKFEECRTIEEIEQAMEMRRQQFLDERRLGLR